MIFRIGFATAAPQAEKAARLLGDVLPWLILLVGLIIAGGVAIYFLRRWMAHDAAAAAGFTLQDLREMHGRGELTDEQFHAAKGVMIGRLADSAKPPNIQLLSQSPPRRGDDNTAA